MARLLSVALGPFVFELRYEDGGAEDVEGEEPEPVTTTGAEIGFGFAPTDPLFGLYRPPAYEEDDDP